MWLMARSHDLGEEKVTALVQEAALLGFNTANILKAMAVYLNPAIAF